MDKKSFRQDCLKRLKKIPQNRAYLQDIRASKFVEKIILSHQPKSVLFYLPLSLEVDLRKLLRELRPKLKIFTPFIVGKSFKMVKYRLPLRRNSFDIYEPFDSHFVQKSVDMVIVPVVGVDGNFKRIGFGKGMYDRFYEKLLKKPVTLFIQREKCVTHHKITDHHDIKADYYITPKEIIKIGNCDVNRNHTSRRRRDSRRCRCLYKREKNS